MQKINLDNFFSEKEIKNLRETISYYKVTDTVTEIFGKTHVTAILERHLRNAVKEAVVEIREVEEAAIEQAVLNYRRILEGK